MARQGYKVIDSDLHIHEPADLWQQYIAPVFKSQAPVGLSEYFRDVTVLLDGKNMVGSVPYGKVLPKKPKSGENPQTFADALSSSWNAASQVRAMDAEGVDVAVLFPTRALWTLALDGMDPQLSSAISRAYDDFLHDFCQEAPQRMFGASHATPHDISGAVLETHRSVEKLGFKAIFLRPNVINGRNWHDPYYDPLWAACQRLNIPVCFHEGGRTPGIRNGETQPGSNFVTNMLHHSCSHPMSQMMALVSFCGSGLLERFPNLRVAFLEANSGWLPWLLWRLDEHYEWTGWEHPELKMKPSEYFKRQCFVSAECDEWPARYAIEAGLTSSLVFSTDYPHPDSKFPQAVEQFLGQDFPDDAKRRILWDNCMRLYALP